MDFPKRIIQHQHEAESFAILLYKLRKIGIFRNLTENDYGIDFEIELVSNGRLTGKYLKVQVKSAESLKIRKKDKAPTISGIKQSTLWYWAELSFSTNVLVFAVDLKDEKIYLTKPIFWQATHLIDQSNETKTIEFIPISEHHTEVAKALTYFFMMAPTIRDHIYYHSDILRHLKQFLELHCDVFHLDPHMSIHDPDLFRHFLEDCRHLLWSKRISEMFPGEDQDRIFSIDYWKMKTEYRELYNYICQIPMGVLFPEILNELSRLREYVLTGSYYWIYRNISYLRLVYCYLIPTERDIGELCRVGDEYDKNYLKQDREFEKYLYDNIQVREEKK